jgi:hypothetical protein
MNAERRAIARRLGVRFATCSHCTEKYVFKSGEEHFSVMQNTNGDFDNGNNEVFLCCSRQCADLKLASLPAESSFVWRSGPCGGTVMP